MSFNSSIGNAFRLERSGRLGEGYVAIAKVSPLSFDERRNDILRLLEFQVICLSQSGVWVHPVPHRVKYVDVGG